MLAFFTSKQTTHFATQKNTFRPEGLDDWSEEVFCSVTMKSENCPFGVAECETTVIVIIRLSYTTGST